MAQIYDTSEQPCVCGSGIITRLRCSRCDKPICPQCMVGSPVGYRCQECAAGRPSAIYATSTPLFLRAIGVGLAVAVGVGVLWGYFPEWEFYLALLLGFGVVEAMARAANYRRGGDLMVAAMCMITLGLIVSRYVMTIADPALTLDLLLNNLGSDFVRQAFYLRLLPDLLFAAIPYVIAYLRFR